MIHFISLFILSVLFRLFELSGLFVLSGLFELSGLFVLSGLFELSRLTVSSRLSGLFQQYLCLQQVTGCLDVCVCVAVLQRTAWEVETAVHEHLTHASQVCGLAWDMWACVGY